MKLNQMLSYFDSQAYLEKEAKDKLNLKKEGESVVIVPEAPTDQSIVVEENKLEETTQAIEPANENNLIKWWKFFFKR